MVIASPNHTHHQILLDAIERPVHILMEKPLCTTLADCREVVEAAAASGHDRVIWMGLEYRYMPPTQRLIEELDAGTVGDVKMVAIREHRFPFLPKVDNWNRFSRNTGGTLVEKTCHFFDLMLQITQARPVRVYASGGSRSTISTSATTARRPTSWTTRMSSSTSTTGHAACSTCACSPRRA